MNLKIGKANFEVDRIIYISPNGSDDNDGLSKNTPLLTIKYAKDKLIDLGGGAICFMEGTHNFTNSNQLTYWNNNDNSSIITDSKDNYASTNAPIIFYSENIKNTKILLDSNNIYRTHRIEFINLFNKDSKIINCNIICTSSNAPRDLFNGLLTGTDKNIPLLIDGCIFDISIDNLSYIPLAAHSAENAVFNNCVFITHGKPLVAGKSSYNSSNAILNNCIYENADSTITPNNCFKDDKVGLYSIDTLLKFKDNNLNKVGISNSDYILSEAKKILLQKILSSDLNNINLDEETFNLLFTDNNELYINNNSNELVKIIHSPHSNIDILNKLSIDDSKNLLYNNKKVQYKDILTIEDIMNIKYEVIGVNPYKIICELANIDYSSYNSINEIISIKENREKIINSEKAIEYLFNSNDKYFVDSFISNSDMFYLIANNETSMTLLCNSEIARNSIYDNYLITENIIANSNIAMSTMMNSSRFEKVSHSMTTEFSNLYDNKAFVFGISQEWHNGATRVTNTHGHYINVEGNTISEISSRWVDQGIDGLKYRVNKFADYVCQKNSYGNGSICHATIFKI